MMGGMVSRARACILSLALASSLWTSCGGETVNPRPNDAAVLRFVLPADGSMPRFLEVPWPSDVFLQNGRIVEAIPGFSDWVRANDAYIRHELARMDGFSRTTHAFFVLDDLGAPKDDEGNVAPATIDPTSLPARETDCVADGSSVFLVDLAATDPMAARVPCRAEYHDDRRYGSITRPLLAVGPARGVVLDEAHAYAAVVTARVKTTSGKNIQASDAFVAASAGTGFWGDRVRSAQKLLGKALDGTSIVGIAPYTTHTRARELYDLRASLDAEPIPKLAWDAKSTAPMGNACFAKAPAVGFTATLDDWLGVVDPKNKLKDGSDDPSNELPVRAHDKIASFATAVFDASYYLLEMPGGYMTIDDATFARDATGKIVPSPTRPKQKIWVTFAVPDVPMPAGGYPAVIVQHGMGSSRSYLLDLMNEITRGGYIAVAIDSLTFGARALDPEAQKDLHTAFEDKAKYKGPDGLSDSPPTVPLDLFGQLANLGAFRDQLRQAAIDTAQLVRVIRNNPDLSVLATSATIPKIDPERVGYFGESLGSIEGEVACAIEPNLKAWFFSVGGGGIILEAASHAPGLGAYVGPFAGIEWSFLRDRFTETHLLVNLIQTILEPADPLTYAPDLVKSPRAAGGKPPVRRNVALLEVIWDELVANEAGEAFARAAGLGLATPNVGSNAGTVDLADMSKNTGRVPFTDVKPDGAGAFHDTPFPGITAVVVQASPAGHGYDVVRKQAKRSYAIPYLRTEESTPFVSLGDQAFWVDNPYLQLTETIRRWFTSAFVGVPNAFVLAPPVRDFDGDGTLDDKDQFPSDPSKH
jgi:hypothetical protein